MTKSEIEAAIAAAVADITIKHENAYRVELKKVAELRRRELDLLTQKSAIDKELDHIGCALQDGWTALREMQDAQVAALM